MKKPVRFSVEAPDTQGAMMTQVLTDRQTGVQYLLAIYPNIGSGLTVLVDADGKPLQNPDQ